MDARGEDLSLVPVTYEKNLIVLVCHCGSRPWGGRDRGKV